jgi:hypothetical protein
VKEHIRGRKGRRMNKKGGEGEGWIVDRFLQVGQTKEKES